MGPSWRHFFDHGDGNGGDESDHGRAESTGEKDPPGNGSVGVKTCRLVFYLTLRSVLHWIGGMAAASLAIFLLHTQWGLEHPAGLIACGWLLGFSPALREIKDMKDGQSRAKAFVDVFSWFFGAGLGAVLMTWSQLTLFLLEVPQSPPPYGP